MPPMGGLTDQQIADVLTFVLRAYGPNAGPVSAAEVKTVRGAAADRNKPWMAAELE
jgi:mono/diheme cytochrome c family protein